MKYIIELEDEPMIANSFNQEVDELWKAKGFNSLVFDKYGLYKLTPYTELDRKAIEDEVWEFAWKIFSMNMGEYAEIFDNKGCPSDYGEAKSKYDAWKKSRSEICIGDELKDDGNIRAVVLDMRDEDYKSYEVFTENGVIDEWQEGIVVKTGRHFDEVESLLKKMEED